MLAASKHWGPDGFSIWSQGPAALGHLLRVDTPQAALERLPAFDARADLAFTAAARLDNREELARQLEVPAGEVEKLADGELLRRAYLRWGERCPERVLGDWSFAAWHPRERRAMLARDQLGNTALYYFETPRLLAFATSQQALLTPGLAEAGLDETYLAAKLLAWPPHLGARTIYRAIKRLPPAHRLTVTESRASSHCYWRLEDVPVARTCDPRDAAQELREHLQRAVRSRLRSNARVAISLSGGLDSGSVAVTAASALDAGSDPLLALTSVPESDPSPFVEGKFGDEWSRAQAVCAMSGRIAHEPIRAGGISPVEAIRRALDIHWEPMHSAASYHWMIALQQRARQAGCRVLLTGHMGNGGISWRGHKSSQTALGLLRLLGPGAGAWLLVKQAIPEVCLATWRRLRGMDSAWYRFSAIHPQFLNRLRLLDGGLFDSPGTRCDSPQAERRRILGAGCSAVGAFNAQLGAAHGLSVRDPTADVRLLSFALGLPDRVFIDPATGLDRWPIREAMKGRLPDEVRLERSTGRQSGDLVPRLRTYAHEVEAALEEVSCGPAAEYLDLAHMRDVWRIVLCEDTPRAFLGAVSVLTRGLMAGLFVNRLRP
ncbi:MAG: asparagine synthetase B [Candidatus Wallbacteria bacterium]|nr:asparagine synthetase B [Candidatus Wallbacteria bacterium]